MDPTSGNFGNPYKSVAVRRGLRSLMPVLRDGELGFCTDTKELAIGFAGTNYFFAGAPSAPFIGDLANPEVIDPAVGLAAISPSVRDQVHLVTGQPGAGAQAVTAAKQVPSGGFAAQFVRLVGSSDTDYPVFSDGRGLRLNGEWRGTLNAVLTLMCLGAGQDFIEVGRS